MYLSEILKDFKLKFLNLLYHVSIVQFVCLLFHFYLWMLYPFEKNSSSL